MAEPLTADVRVMTETDSLPLNLIAQISPSGHLRCVFGDTDHDGRYEVIVSWLNPEGLCCFYKVIEEQGNNAYSEEYQGGALFPQAIGDLDGDGKAEIIGQFAGQMQVYESLSSTSYPTELVWNSGYLSSDLGSASVADTDRDGRMEIIKNVGLGSNNTWLLILENVGDNAFEQVFFERMGYGGEHTIADLDQDGLTEIAFGGLSGRVRVYESPANDTWVQVWTDSTELWSSTASEGGSDTDGNGRPELFVMGNGPDGWTTVVYEATCDNQFVRVSTLSFLEGPSGSAYNELANLDGVGADEYLMQGQCCLWIYQSRSPGQWEMVQEITDPDGLHHGLNAFDVNRNGRPELYWSTDAANQHFTLVLEHPTGASGGDPVGTVHVPSLSISPNPIRGEATLCIQGVADAGHLAVYDVAGRLVERRALLRDAQGRPLWPVRHLSAGIYFLRLERAPGSSQASTRAVVVR